MRHIRFCRPGAYTNERRGKFSGFWVWTALNENGRWGKSGGTAGEWRARPEGAGKWKRPVRKYRTGQGRCIRELSGGEARREAERQIGQALRFGRVYARAFMKSPHFMPHARRCSNSSASGNFRCLRGECIIFPFRRSIRFDRLLLAEAAFR